jgi:hypothetical protein
LVIAPLWRIPGSALSHFVRHEIALVLGQRASCKNRILRNTTSGSISISEVLMLDIVSYMRSGPPNMSQPGQKTSRRSDPEEKWQIAEEGMKSGNVSEASRQVRTRP